MNENSSDLNDTTQLVELAVGGDSEALAKLLEKYRDRLKRMVRLRMDLRLLGRVDASDIVQDALIEASQRLSQLEWRKRLYFE